MPGPVAMSRFRMGLPRGFSDNESSDDELDDLGSGSMGFNPYGSFADVLSEEDGRAPFASMAPASVIHNRTEFFAQSIDDFTGVDVLASPTTGSVPPMQPQDRELLDESSESPAGRRGELRGLMSPIHSPSPSVVRPRAVRAAKNIKKQRSRGAPPSRSPAKPSPGLSPFFESEVEAVLLGIDRLHMDAVMHQVEVKKHELLEEHYRREGAMYTEEYSLRLRTALHQQNKSVSSCLGDFKARQRKATEESRAELSKYRSSMAEMLRQKDTTASLSKAAIRDFLAVSSLFSSLESRCKRIEDPTTPSSAATHQLQKCTTTLEDLRGKVDKLAKAIDKLEDTVGSESIVLSQQTARLEEAYHMESRAEKLVKRAARVRDEKVAEEKERELLEKKKRVEEAKKKIEEEQRAKEAAIREAQQEKEQKKQAALVQAKKAEEDAAKTKEAQERLSQAKAKALENFKGTAKLSLSAAAFEDYKKYTAAYEEVQDAARDISCMKPIKLVFNQVSASKQHTEQRTVALCGFFETVKNNPAKMAYCAKYFADQLVTKAEDVVRSKELTFIISYLALCVCSKFPVFGPVLKGKLYLSCSYTVPLYFKRDGFDSEEAYLAAQGRTATTEEEKYLKRMEGLVQLYACMNILTVPLRMDDGSYPFGMDVAWTWLARFGNLAGAEHSPRMLMCFLQVAGHSLQQRYGRQFIKLVIYFGSSYFKDNVLTCPDLDKPSVTRYQAFLKQFATTKVMSKFPGHDYFH